MPTILYAIFSLYQCRQYGTDSADDDLLTSLKLFACKITRIVARSLTGSCRSGSIRRGSCVVSCICSVSNELNYRLEFAACCMHAYIEETRRFLKKYYRQKDAHDG